MDVRPKKMGEDPALVLDQQAWNASGIDGEADLEVISDGSGVHVRPKSDEHRARVLASAMRMMDRHEEASRKLAR